MAVLAARGRDPDASLSESAQDFHVHALALASDGLPRDPDARVVANLHDPDGTVVVDEVSDVEARAVEEEDHVQTL